MNRKLFPAAAAAATLLFAVTASAGPIYDPSVSSCTERNCSAINLGGTVTGVLTSPLPWVGQFYAGANECLRLEVTSQETDMEMRVVAPDGSKTWLNDDSALTPCPLCPLLAILTRKHQGWFTVHIGEFGGASVQANFTLAYARYPKANPNCTTFITPAAAPAGAIDKSSDSPEPDPSSAPGR